MYIPSRIISIIYLFIFLEKLDEIKLMVLLEKELGKMSTSNSTKASALLS